MYVFQVHFTLRRCFGKLCHHDDGKVNFKTIIITANEILQYFLDTCLRLHFM